MFIIIANKKESPNPVAMWVKCYTNQIKVEEDTFFYYILLPHRFITQIKKEKENEEKCPCSVEWLFVP